MTSNEELGYKLALQTAVKACQIARTLLDDGNIYEDLVERIEGAEVELSDMENEFPANHAGLTTGDDVKLLQAHR